MAGVEIEGDLCGSLMLKQVTRPAWPPQDPSHGDNRAACAITSGIVISKHAQALQTAGRNLSDVRKEVVRNAISPHRFGRCRA